MAGVLYIVGTPIGNLEDLTFRAARILREADAILCEDTRVTSRLLAKYDIAGKRLLIWNEEKSGTAVEKIAALLMKGENIALVTDAGTPGVSDPGSRLVEKIREILPEAKIESVPGPSALAAALSVAGLPISDFTFLGFLPHKKGRETRFKEIAQSKRSMVFYESPHRIIKTLESLRKHAPDKKITIARELSKIHEEILAGSAEDVLAIFQNNPEKSRGEFVVIISAE